MTADEPDPAGAGAGPAEAGKGGAEDGGEERAENGEGFEAALERLEGVVRRLDREELDLDEALALFEQGVADLRTASRRLDEARGRVEELIEDAAGELETVDFDLPTDEAGD